MEFLLIVSCLYSLAIIGLVIVDRHDERKLRQSKRETDKK